MKKATLEKYTINKNKHVDWKMTKENKTELFTVNNKEILSNKFKKILFDDN